MWQWAPLCYVLAVLPLSWLVDTKGVRAASLAYCAQQPFVRNAALRDNVTFGRPFDERRYRAAVERAELSEDIAILPDGDETEVRRARRRALGRPEPARVARARARAA